MLTLADIPDARASATAIADVEKRIAEIQWPLEKARNKDMTYNLKNRSELEKFAPEFPVDVRCLAPQVSRTRTDLWSEKPMPSPVWPSCSERLPRPRGVAYLTFHYLNSQDPISVPAAFDEAHFAFSGKVLGGQTTAARALEACRRRY